MVVAAPSQSLAAAAALAGPWASRRVSLAMLSRARRGIWRPSTRRWLWSMQAAMEPGDAPLVLLSGGSDGARRGAGTGGPNAEFALAAAIGLAGRPGIHAIACDTDGVDGAAEVAGALVGPDTLAWATSAGQNAEAALAAHDSHGFFGAIGDQVVTGPTLTNVNDFRALIVEPLPC